jgi:hypothetical protein
MLKPTPDGSRLAKDVWLSISGRRYVGDGLADGARDAAKSAGRSVPVPVL